MNPSSIQQWFYAANGQRQGTVSFDELRRVALLGRLAKTDLVWTKGMKDWQPASSIEGLFPKSAPDVATALPAQPKPGLAPKSKPPKGDTKPQPPRTAQRSADSSKLPLLVSAALVACGIIAATAYWFGTRNVVQVPQAASIVPAPKPQSAPEVSQSPSATPVVAAASPSPQSEPGPPTAEPVPAAPQPDAIPPAQSHGTDVAAPEIHVGDTYTYESVATDADGKVTNSISTRQVKTVEGDRVTITFMPGSGKPQTLIYDRQWNFVESGDMPDAGLTYDPPLKYFDFPLTAGKKWSAVSTETNKKTGKTRQFTINGEVVGLDSNIGTLDGHAIDGIKIKCETLVEDGDTRTSGTDISWYVSTVGRSVYSTISGQFADGRQDSKTIRLVNFTPSNRLVESVSVMPVQPAATAPVAAPPESALRPTTQSSGIPPSFDCRRASSPTENAICASPDLQNLDGQLGRIFSDVIAIAPASRLREVRAEQKAWIKDRDATCNEDAACLGRYYRERLATLKQITVAALDSVKGMLTLSVIGTGTTVTEARQDAIRLALQQAMTQLIIADRIIEDDKVTRDKVMSTLNGFVEGFKEKQIKRNGKEIELSADITVSPTKIVNYLGSGEEKKSEFSGASAFAEAQRAAAQNVIRGEMLDRFFRGFPSYQFIVKLSSVRVDEAHPDRLDLTVEIRIDPAFVHSLESYLRQVALGQTDSFGEALHQEGDGRSICLLTHRTTDMRGGTCYVLPPGTYFKSLVAVPYQTHNPFVIGFLDKSGDLVERTGKDVLRDQSRGGASLLDGYMHNTRCFGFDNEDIKGPFRGATLYSFEKGLKAEEEFKPASPDNVDLVIFTSPQIVQIEIPVSSIDMQKVSGLTGAVLSPIPPHRTDDGHWVDTDTTLSLDLSLGSSTPDGICSRIAELAGSPLANH